MRERACYCAAALAFCSFLLPFVNVYITSHFRDDEGGSDLLTLAYAVP